jgi:hypothetical protein
MPSPPVSQYQSRVSGNVASASYVICASTCARGPTCPKLSSYWQFHDCRYNKTRYTCAEPDHLPGCPLPNHWLRNGRLNQTVYALHLFIRDVAVAWIDRRLTIAAKQPGPDRLATMRAALLDPLKEVYGVSDKILMMALSVLFLGAQVVSQFEFLFPGRADHIGGALLAFWGL